MKTSMDAVGQSWMESRPAGEHGRDGCQTRAPRPNRGEAQPWTTTVRMVALLGLSLILTCAPWATARAASGLKIIARTGEAGLTKLFGASINDAGLVAFTGDASDQPGVFVGDGIAPPQRLIGGLVGTGTTRGNLSRQVQINNAGQVVTMRGPAILNSDPVIYYDPFLGPIVLSPGYSETLDIVELVAASDPAIQLTIAQSDFVVDGDGNVSIGRYSVGPFSRLQNS